MKILYVVNHFKFHGGIERMLSNKIDAWSEFYQYEVIVVTLNQGNSEIVYPPKFSFRLIDLEIKNANTKNVKDLILLFRKLNKILKKENPDILISTLTGIPSLLLPFINLNIKKYLEIHSSGALSVTKSWKYKWWFLKHYEGVVLLNEDEKQYYQLENLMVIPNFIPIKNDYQPQYTNRQKTIVAAGRIHKDKQYDHLIKIWEKVFSKFPDWSVEIYGDGDEDLLKQYEQYISSNKIERISFKSSTNHLDEVLKNISLFCLTSRTESFSMVLVECKQYSLPAISYDCPNGPRHVIKNDGILVEHNNIDEFAKKLDELINDENLRKRMADNAYNNRTLFSSSEIIKKWRKLI